MINSIRTATALAILLQGLAAAGCEYHGSLTGPTTATPRPPANGGVSIPAVTIGRLSGEFTLTLTADVACDSLPRELRIRTYGATLTVNPSWHSPRTYYDVSVTGVKFLDRFDSSERFYVSMADDDAASFGLGSAQGQPAFVEQLSDTAYFAVGGSASATVPAAASSFAAAMDGYIEYCITKSPADRPVVGGLYVCESDRVLTRVRCESETHSLKWDRRD